MGSKIRIMLADDHEVMRSALRSLLDSRDDLVVVAEAGTGREVLSLPMYPELTETQQEQVVAAIAEFYR